jgi:hypothetical protein
VAVADDQQSKKLSSVYRRKFTAFDDNLLLIGLQQYGFRNIEAIKKSWLP